jgi:hypothetical protein
MKVHMVPNLKLKRLASLVGITFLSGLGSLQDGLDAMDYLLNFCNKVRAKDHPLAELDPVLGCTTSMTIQCFERRHSVTLLITVVVRELTQW